MISATHLAYLTPKKAAYHNAARLHLSKSLHLYHDALSQPISPTNANAVVAVSILFYHYAWASIECLLPSDSLSSSGSTIPDDVNPVDLSNDLLLRFSAGLRDVFLSGGVMMADNHSVFLSHAIYKPRIAIFQAARNTGGGSLEEMETRLLDRYEDLKNQSPASSIVSSTFTGSDTTRDYSDYETLAAYMDASERLAPVLTFLRHRPQLSITPYDGVAKQQQHSELSFPIYAPVYPTLSVFSNGLTPGDDESESLQNESSSSNTPAAVISLYDVSRYLFSFPVLFGHPLNSLALRNDPRALFLLRHFYHAVRSLLPEDLCWWSHRRATYLERMLERMLETT